MLPYSDGLDPAQSAYGLEQHIHRNGVKHGLAPIGLQVESMVDENVCISSRSFTVQETVELTFQIYQYDGLVQMPR